MSGSRHDSLILTLRTLHDVLTEVTGQTADAVQQAHGQRLVDVTALVLGNLLAATGYQYVAKIDDAGMVRISRELGLARLAATDQIWDRVLEHSRTVLDVLPGDPNTYPKENLPPL